MAIIQCPECGKDVSDSAYKCPSCGKQLRKPKRGIMGKLFLWTFYGFNALMALWLVLGLNAASEVETANQAEAAGAAIGAGIGTMMILSLWFFGAIITGLLAFFTRAKE